MSDALEPHAQLSSISWGEHGLFRLSRCSLATGTVLNSAGNLKRLTGPGAIHNHCSSHVLANGAELPTSVRALIVSAVKAFCLAAAPMRADGCSCCTASNRLLPLGTLSLSEAERANSIFCGVRRPVGRPSYTSPCKLSTIRRHASEHR